MARADGEILQGQIYARTEDIEIPFTEQVLYEENADAVIGQDKTEVTPMDGHASRVRVFSVPSDLDTMMLVYPGTVSFELPNVLTEILCRHNIAEGSGHDDQQVGEGVWYGDSGHFTITPTARAQGSASIMPVVEPVIKQTWARNVPTKQYLFYIEGNFETSDVITRLQTHLTIAVTTVAGGTVTTGVDHNMVANQPFQFATVVGGSGGILTATTYYVKLVIGPTQFTYSLTAGGAVVGHSATSGTLYPKVLTWPQFQPVSHTLSVRGQSVSIAQNCGALFEYGWSGVNVMYMLAPAGGSQFDGASRENNVTTQFVQLPPTIHGDITIADSTDTADTTVTVTASIPAVATLGGSPVFAGLSNTPTAISASATGVVTPSFLAGTAGQQSIPTAGLYIHDTKAQPWELGINRVYVELVDFSYFNP